MTPAQVAHITALVNKLKRFSHPIDRHEAAEVVAAVEAALRDAPQAEPDGMLIKRAEWDRLSPGAREALQDLAKRVCAQQASPRNALDREFAATPSAPTAVEPDERAALSEMIDSYALAFHAAIIRPESHDKMKAKAESIMNAILDRASKGTP